MKILYDLNNCTGCGSCINTCPHSAISWASNNEGFTIPTIDYSKCVHCGLCEKCCPKIYPIKDTRAEKQDAYAVISNDDRKKSSSGGAFSIFARYVLSHNGVVFGASFYKKDEKGKLTYNFPHLSHIAIDNLLELDVLRGSKYIQSEIGLSFRDAKKCLKDGKMVLFVGTPCQIAGLYKYLGKRYEGSLITLDLVCHGVPNQELFIKYLHKLKKSPRLSSGNVNIEGFRFRNLDSWSIVPAVKIAKSKWKILEQEDNVYMNAFFKLSIFRESCYQCHYSNMNRVGTFTIADYWGIGKDGLKFKIDVSSGVSLVIDNQGMMSELFEEISQYAYIEERPLDEGRKHNHNLNSPSKRPSERDTAVIDLLDENITLIEYAQKYHLLDGNLKHFIKHTIKELIYSLRLYNVYKSISYKFGQGA